MVSEAGFSVHKVYESQLAQIPLPKKLDLKKPEEWKKWMEQFECYRIAAGLDEKDDKFQINTMAYAMGGNANEILKSFHLSERSLIYNTLRNTLRGSYEYYFWTSALQQTSAR